MLGPPPARGASRGGGAGRSTPRRGASAARRRRMSPEDHRGPRIVGNTVEFAAFALPDEDAELEAENKLLSWKVQQLFTSGEQYRQKVEAMYKDGQARLADISHQIDAARTLKQEADDVALEAASQLALANSTRAKFDKEASDIKNAQHQLATRLSDSKQLLQAKQIDTAVAQAEAEKVDTALAKSTARVAQLEQEIAQVRRKRKATTAETLENLERQAAYASASDGLQAELQVWRAYCEDAASATRTLVDALTAAARDSRQLTKVAMELGHSMAVNVLIEPASPLRVEDGRPEIAALQATRTAFTRETQEMERAIEAKAVATERREEDWSALCHEWRGWGDPARTHQQIVRKHNQGVTAGVAREREGASTSPPRRRGSPPGRGGLGARGSPRRAEWR